MIRKRLALPKSTSLYIFFSNNKLQQNEKVMKQIYEENRDEDGFLYCKYASHEVYGSNNLEMLTEWMIAWLTYALMRAYA